MAKEDCFWHPREGHLDKDCPACDLHLAEYENVVDEILLTLDHEEAYITDQSCVSDFEPEAVEALKAKFGSLVEGHHQLVWNLAKAIHESRQ